MPENILPEISSPAELRRLRPELLPRVCREIREKIISAISKNGGHLGSSLGAADLIVALHYVFDTPQDRLVFDTGHQAYAHKLLTGRYGRFDGIRTKGGISGFLRRDESEYDCFGAGHASTALSAALGMAAARDRKGENRKVVAIVSDGCMTGGMAYEALQNAGHLGTDMLVILNDNQMFISHRVGQLGAFLTRLMSAGSLKNAEQRVEAFLNRFDFWGASLLRVAKRTKVLLFPGMLFEEMGFAYLGPVNGHDVGKLVEILGRIKEMRGPVVLHVATVKGKGYAPAEARPIDYHGLGIFDKVTGAPEPAPAGAAPSFTKVFAQTLVKLAETDPRITAITAAMPEGTGLDLFRDRMPERFYDVGIAEEHAVTFAAGLACEGMRPVVALYSSFSQRAYDQMLHDVCLQKLPVVLALDRAGIVGEDGPTHHGVFDLSLFRNIPNLAVIAPADENELQHALKTALAAESPCVLRYPRGAGFGAAMDKEPQPLPWGKGVWLKRGDAATIIAAGNRVHPSLEAARLLEDKGISCGVINVRFIKPLDEEIIAEAASAGPVITVEDNMLAGGFGSAVLEAFCARGLRPKTLRLGIPDIFVTHGRQRELFDELDLSAGKIAARAAAFIEETSREKTR
ncbi:MAG: 1-deoxy-D-xylulose-5-phosphate synthase [Elusimicrobiales bacterium]